jgi:ABC-2 type transport system ATP-binding protein
MEHIVEVSSLRKEYGALVAVRNVSFTIGQGQVVGLIGPNGAGKTTLLRMVATLLPATSGSIRILGMNADEDYLRVRARIGYLPDFFNLYHDLTLEECLQFFAEAYGVARPAIPARVDSVLRYVDLVEKRRDLTRHLSRGMVQRLGLGTLLVREPGLLLLDEPASGLDPAARIQLRQVLKRLSEEGKTIVISSHILTELSDFCTHVIMMDRGKVVMSGGVEELTARPAARRAVAIEVLDDAQAAARAVATIEGAQVLQCTRNTIHAEISGSREALADLNAALVRAGVRVCGLKEDKTNLEDLFMSMAGRKPTEGGPHE